MRSSFNQLLAALASFDLLYLFTMLLEGVSIGLFFTMLLELQVEGVDFFHYSAKLVYYTKQIYALP